jgi:hypothetical protein
MSVEYVCECTLSYLLLLMYIITWNSQLSFVLHVSSLTWLPVLHVDSNSFALCIYMYIVPSYVIILL